MASESRSVPTSVRAAVHARDHHRCRWCGVETGELHHIIYRSQGGQNSVDNLITLCIQHHAQAHSNKGRYAPLLLACLEFQRQGTSLSIPQIERWLRRPQMD